MRKSDEVNERRVEMSGGRTECRGDIEEGRKSRRKECGRCTLGNVCDGDCVTAVFCAHDKQDSARSGEVKVEWPEKESGK